MLLQTGTFTHRRLYTKNLLHRSFYRRMLLHTNALTHWALDSAALAQKSTYIQIYHTHTEIKLLHSEALAQKSFHTANLFSPTSFYTLQLIHTGTFTCRSFDTDAFTQRSFYTQKLPHAEAFRQSSFHAQKLLHTEAFTHRSLYTQRLLHTEAFTKGSFYTENLSTEQFLHASNSNRPLLPTHFRPFSCIHTGPFSMAPISIRALAPAATVHVRASTLAHAHCNMALLPTHFHPYPCTLLPTHFHPFPCTRTVPTSVHPRSLKPTLRPSRPHTSPISIFSIPSLARTDAVRTRPRNWARAPRS